MFGYTREDFLDMHIGSVYELALPEDLPEIKTKLQKSMTQMKSVHFTFRAKKKDGTVFYVSCRNSVHYVSEKGQMIFVTFYEDISKIKREEDRIKTLNTKLGNSEVYMQLDLSSRKMIEYHSQYEPNDNFLTGKLDYQQLLLSQVYEEDKESVQRALSYENLLACFGEGETKLSIEYRRYILNRDIRWFAATAVLIEDAIKGKVNAFIYCHDVDAKIKKRMALNMIVDTEVTDVIIINVASGMDRILKINDGTSISDAAIRCHDESVERFICREVAKEDQKMCREFFTLTSLLARMQENKSIDISFWTISQAGEYCRKNATISYLDGTKKDLLLVGRDITSLFEKEQEQQTVLRQALELADFANKAKSDFLSRMSHDIRTSLNGILGMNRLSIEENKTPEIVEYLKGIEISGRFLLGLVNDCLDLSKIESGKMELHREAFSMDEFILGINTVVRPLMEEKNIEFHINLKNFDKYIFVDKIRFNQIFFNLLSNAAKYTHEGGCVEFALEDIPSRDGKLGMRFIIADNGIGMSKEYLDVLFEPFSQEYGITHAEQKGTGLGLAIVKQILDLTDGTIRVESKLGEGTKFVVEMYAETLENDKQKQTEMKYDLDNLRNLHILLVEDTEVNAVIMKKILGYKGCHVDIAANGTAGVIMFEQSERDYYDIILTDIRMPIMDGFEEAKRIRALDRPDAKCIPIIAASADAYDDIQEKIQDAGINERLIKPIDAELLCETISRLVGIKS